MARYCNCDMCLQNKSIENPYDFYQGDFKLDDVKLIFDYRTSALCMFGCKRYGQKATCPPNIPGIDYYSSILKSYERCSIIGKRYPYSDGYFSSHWRNYSTNELHNVLLEREAELFNEGHAYAKAFIGGSCKLCPDERCDPKKCRIPSRSRSPIESTGVNVFRLMNTIGLEYQEPPKEYVWRIGIVFY